jgi:hypothetical protein
MATQFKTVICDYCFDNITCSIWCYPVGWTPGLGPNSTWDCCSKTACRIAAGLQKPLYTMYPMYPVYTAVPAVPAVPVIHVYNKPSKKKVVPKDGWYIKKF